MARLMVALVVAILLFGGVIAADQMLDNPDVEPADTDDAAQQEQFVEATAPFISAAAPIALFALVVGIMLGAARAVGGA